MRTWNQFPSISAHAWIFVQWHLHKMRQCVQVWFAFWFGICGQLYACGNGYLQRHPGSVCNLEDASDLRVLEGHQIYQIRLVFAGVFFELWYEDGGHRFFCPSYIVSASFGFVAEIWLQMPFGVRLGWCKRFAGQTESNGWFMLLFVVKVVDVNVVWRTGFWVFFCFLMVSKWMDVAIFTMF